MAARTSKAFASRSRGRDAGTDAVTNQFAFEFRDTRKDAEYQPAVRRRGIDAFVQGNELDSQRLKVAENVDELAKTSREPIVAMYDDSIESAFPAARE